YVFMTSHKPPEEAFNFRRHNANDKMSTQRDWGQFYRRLDYVIEFKGIWHDEMDLHTTKLIFHKGCGAGIEQYQDGEVIIKADNQVYWRRCFPEFKKNYLRDYPRCRELSDYKQKLLQQSQLRLKCRIKKFINDSDHDDVNISNSHMMLDDNYFVQRPVEVIEMTDEYASNQGRSVLIWRKIIEKQNEESRRLNEEN
ncbi:1318_t:CDS:2, partial [Dentiscutata heterogama]